MVSIEFIEKTELIQKEEEQAEVGCYLDCGSITSYPYHDESMTYLHKTESESKYENGEKAVIQREQGTTSIRGTERRMVLYSMVEGHSALSVRMC